MNQEDKTNGWPFFYCLDGGAALVHKHLLQRLRNHIDHAIALAEADLDAAARDPTAFAFVCVRVGALYRLNARKSPCKPEYVEDWPASFARADVLARELVGRQTRLLVQPEVLVRIAPRLSGKIEPGIGRGEEG
jgi:hypothetical protein